MNNNNDVYGMLCVCVCRFAAFCMLPSRSRIGPMPSLFSLHVWLSFLGMEIY